MRFLVAGLLLGCHASHTAPPTAADYEHGAGVPRDFRMAAKLDADACRAGCGDLAACHALLELAFDDRGITPSLADLPTAFRICHRGDVVACWALVLLGFDNRIREPAVTSCEQGNRVACERDLMTDFGMPSLDDAPKLPTADDIRNRMTGPAARLCAMGGTDGCLRLVWPCDHRACIDERAETARDAGVDAAPLFAAWAAIDRACTAGDVDACDVAGRPIAKPARCAAGDREACGDDPMTSLRALRDDVLALLDRCRKADLAACALVASLYAADCR